MTKQNGIFIYDKVFKHANKPLNSTDNNIVILKWRQISSPWNEAQLRPWLKTSNEAMYLFISLSFQVDQCASRFRLFSQRVVFRSNTIPLKTTAWEVSYCYMPSWLCSNYLGWPDWKSFEKWDLAFFTHFSNCASHHRNERWFWSHDGVWLNKLTTFNNFTPNDFLMILTDLEFIAFITKLLSTKYEKAKRYSFKRPFSVQEQLSCSMHQEILTVSKEKRL